MQNTKSWSLKQPICPIRNFSMHAHNRRSMIVWMDNLLQLHGLQKYNKSLLCGVIIVQLWRWLLILCSMLVYVPTILRSIIILSSMFTKSLAHSSSAIQLDISNLVCFFPVSVRKTREMKFYQSCSSSSIVLVLEIKLALHWSQWLHSPYFVSKCTCQNLEVVLNHSRESTGKGFGFLEVQNLGIIGVTCNM